MTTPEAATNTNPVRILVVDDHPNTAATLARALTQLGPGVNVTYAASGYEALDKVKNTGVDILFTDMIMPEMTGLELIEKLQRHPGGKPEFNYLITAYDVPGLKVTAMRLKVNEVIVKPVRPERICQIATQAMEEMKNSTRHLKKLSSAKRKFKVLVADDRPDNVTLLVRYLGYEGYDIITAQDGIETLDKIRDELPDLALLDINMPNKDGFAVLEEVRADPALAHIPVIFLTAARLDPADVQSGLNLGADDYVTKPFDRHELMARIRTKLRVKEAEDIIRRRNRELNLLPEIGRELSARLDVKDVANVLLKRTVETLGAFQGNLVIYNPEGSVEQNHQVNASNAGNINQGIKITDGLLNLIRETQQGVIIANTASDPNWVTDPKNPTRSAMAVPLFGRRELLGLLILAHENEDYFTLEQLLLLQAIASQASIAIENSRLYFKASREQKRLEAVLQNAAEAILMFDDKGFLRLLNPIGQKLFTDFNARLNEPLQSGHGYDEFTQMVNETLATPGAISREVTWPDQRTFVATITPIETGGAVAVLHDITRFKDLEKIKNEFIATASHDLKNPLTSILGFSELLMHSGALNPKHTDYVTRILRATHTMTELIENMLDLVRIDMNVEREHEPIEMDSLLAEVADEFKPQAEGKRQKLNFVSAKTQSRVSGDSLQLHQVFRNLIGNAIKYSPNGGGISIVLEEKNNEAIIKVQDTGYGIPSADLPYIFDRFYRVRNNGHDEVEGNGLGLAIVKSIVDKHAGQISVESEREKGSCFSVSFPLLASAENGLPESEHISNAKRQN